MDKALWKKKYFKVEWYLTEMDYYQFLNSLTLFIARNRAAVNGFC